MHTNLLPKSHCYLRNKASAVRSPHLFVMKIVDTFTMDLVFEVLRVAALLRAGRTEHYTWKCTIVQLECIYLYSLLMEQLYNMKIELHTSYCCPSCIFWEQVFMWYWVWNHREISSFFLGTTRCSELRLLEFITDGWFHITFRRN